jgi:hypothetical protein
MIVGPPGALKTTMIRTLEEYHDATVASDLNNVTLSSLREGMSAGTLRTIVLPELKKIYQHHPSVSSNMEGTLQAMADEGFSQPSYRDSRMQGTRARCAIVSALTENFYQRKYTDWGESGFSRRFLWSLISLNEPEILMEAVIKWKAIDIELEKIIRVPPTEHIPESLSEQDRRRLRNVVKHQPGSGPLQFQILCKMCAVLKWHYAKRRIDKDPIATILEFGKSLSKEGAQIVL